MQSANLVETSDIRSFKVVGLVGISDPLFLQDIAADDRSILTAKVIGTEISAPYIMFHITGLRMLSVLERDHLNAFTRHTHVEVRGVAEGPLKGLTFGVKDIYDVAGVKSGFGSPAWFDTHEVPSKSAKIVQLLLQAGASVIGKTHSDELAWSINGINAHYGRPINVRAEGRICGGSSSGSAAAVAAGLCDFALGSDTGGSIRLPASYTGIYGIRPTHGRLPHDGILPLAPSFDTAGWFARDTKTFAEVGRVLLQDGSWNTKPPRLLIAEDVFALLDSRERQALQPAIDRIEKLYGKAHPVKIGDRPLRQCFEIYRVIQAAEIWNIHGPWVERHKPRFGPGIQERMDGAAKSDPVAVDKAKMMREQVASHVRETLRDGSLLLLPSVPGIAPLVDSAMRDVEDYRSRAVSLLSVSVLARTPQISLPLAELDRCPLGISIMGAQCMDEMLIEAARDIAES